MKTTNTTPPHEPSHRSPSAIERDIARARESMDSTLDELAQKIDPRSRIESAESWVREKAEDIDLDTVKDTASDWARKGARGVRDNPVPVALTALALASFFIPKRSNGSSSNGSSLLPGTGDSSDSFREKSRDELRSIRESVDDSVEEAKARADDLSSRTTAKARRIADAAREKTDELTDRAGDKLRDAGESVRSASRTGAEKARDAGDRFTDATQRHPLLVGAGAAAAGFLVALALPRTRKEDELCGSEADQFRARVREGTREKLRENDLDREGLHRRADEAVEKVSDEAEEVIDERVAPSDSPA